MLRDSPNVIVELSQSLGAQALIGALPLNVEIINCIGTIIEKE